MKIDLIPVKKFIIANNLKEITESILFEKGFIPTSGGLLSTDIFGVSINERKETYAYISLNGHFLHPFIYKLLRRMNRNFEAIVAGTKSFKLDKDGRLIEDSEKGDTGIEFLYKIWEKINFEKNMSSIRNERIDLLNSYKKDTLFTEFWLVMPAFYRDVNLQSARQGVISHHPVNDKYSKLIRLTSILRNENNFDFVLNTTRAKIQETLVEIYDFYKSKIEKKQGIIRRSLLGKNIDYGARSVISAPVFNSNRPEEMTIDFYHCGIPLAQCCSMFTPFIVGWVRRYFQMEFEKSGNKYPVKSKTGEFYYVTLKEPASYFNEEYIKKQIDRFVHSPADRFDEIELPVEDSRNGNPVYLTFIGRKSKQIDELAPEDLPGVFNRRATWCDILYRAAVEVTSDKMVYTTRYPILDYFGTFPNKITVLSTHKTFPMIIGDTVYPNYPIIDTSIPKDQISVSFADTVTMSNLYLKGLSGDYDGDQVTVKGVFSQQANIEAEKLMRSKGHILNIYGENMRRTTNEGIQTLYMLTKFEES